MDDELLEREDAIGALARAAFGITEREETRIGQACMQASQQAEQRARRSMAEEISQSALPQVLPDIPSRTNFEVAGKIERGTGKDSLFYDYFFIDPGLLCIVIGQIQAAAFRKLCSWWSRRRPSAAVCVRAVRWKKPWRT